METLDYIADSNKLHIMTAIDKKRSDRNFWK